VITRPEESYRLWCVVECDLETSRMRRPWPTGGCCAKRKKVCNGWYEWMTTALWVNKRNFTLIFLYNNTYNCGPGSSVGIATDYGLDGPGSNPRGDEIFPGAHQASCKMGTGSFPGVKCGRDVLLTTHPLLVPRSWKSRAIPLPTLWATPGL